MYLLDSSTRHQGLEKVKVVFNKKRGKQIRSREEKAKSILISF
jgi:hypothetical protein